MNQIICLIDDDPIYQTITKKIIHKSETASKILSFPNGAEAINGLTGLVHQPEEFPDIIMLDIEMPVMDGWNFMEQFQKVKNLFPKEVSIYIVSSSIACSDKERSQNCNGILGYFTKPVTLQNVLEIAKS
ncbi:response regulator [Flavobacterium microcysteis]|uniref:Response regulator n=1 Tax=Flavobacterium microcysteis TaxID=2596891 RepID=A0A501Q5J5_9FLAO|nr:response regulator [Flavobacterium microcysteis]TPD67286.1 response regulator [Flavobacterium microcysteis]